MATSMSGLQSIESLKATGGESEFFSRWSGQTAKLVSTSNMFQVYSLSLRLVPSTLTILATVIILGWGALQVMDSVMSIGTLVAFQSLMASFMGPLNQLVVLGSSLQEIEGGVYRLNDVLNDPEDSFLQLSEAADQRADAYEKLPGSLNHQDVTYGYNRLGGPLIDRFQLPMVQMMA